MGERAQQRPACETDGAIAGDGIACLRNQLFAKTMAQTVAQPMMEARAANGQEPAPQLGHGGLLAEAILALAPRTARRQ